jgi:hypothetical protein
MVARMSPARAGLALLLLLGPAGGATRAGAVAPPLPDLERILSEGKKVQKSDVAAWKAYRFRRRAVREQMAESGEVLEREDLEFLVTPAAAGFDETLLRLDGKDPRPDEVRRHRRIAKFTKHYDTLLVGEGEDDVEGGYSLSQLLNLSSYRYAGREERNGVACHRLDFSPDDTEPKDGIAGRFAGAMEGSLWITVEGHHLAGARARTVRPLSFALFLTKVHGLEVDLQSQPVGEGVWLPLRIEVITRARILVKQVRKRNLYDYSEFTRVGGAPHAGRPAADPAYSSPAIGRSRGARTR